MKKVVLSLGIFLFAIFSVVAQQPATPAPPQNPQADNPNAPEIKFAKLVHDYGTVQKEGDGNCEFEFQNIGKEPLVLSDVRSSCGCTVPSWTREPILPGKKGAIKVKYDTKRVGPINKTITVVSNAKTSSIVLRIQGTVVDNGTGATPEKPQSPTTPTNK
ncbi:MAG: DUF1573 domain-containing protein [Bacteroidetes bacterium]|nr:DUF1573 domain-containing protein [Bacteroidota bacterium]